MKLDLGCGIFKKAGYTGIDSFDHSRLYKTGEFVLGHIPEILDSFEDNTIEEIYCKHFLEHIKPEFVILTMNECHRILKPGGIFEIFVPPSTGRGAFCDPTHVSFWNDMSFRYYDMSWCAELSKSYGINCNFKILKIETLNEFNLHAILKKC